MGVFFFFRLFFSKTLRMLYHYSPITSALLIAAICYFFYKKYLKTPGIRAKPNAYKTDFEPDTVYLYQFKRVQNCPSLSPFCMKIEILCRAYGIPYVICDKKRIYSRNGTLPFIELNGEHIADSDLIERRLRELFKIPALPAVKEAQSIALTRLADNHLFNVLIRYKAAGDGLYLTILGLIGLPAFLTPILLPIFKAAFGRKIYNRSKMAIGDFEPADLDALLHTDLQVIQDFLGDQKFLFGDKITPVDATVFGQLATVYYPFRCHIGDVLERDFPKIVEYMERVRHAVYPNDFTI